MIHIDIETKSGADLKKTGVHRYVEDPDFSVILVAVAAGDEEPRLIGANELYEILRDPNNTFAAFNASFERTCLAKQFDMPMPAERWQCTMVKAYTAGYAGGLGQVAIRLGLPYNMQKDREGMRLIRKFCLPPFHARTGDDWDMFRRYCKQDVIVERGVHHKLSAFKVEERLWQLDQRINDRGVLIDTPFAERAVEIASMRKRDLMRQAKEMTGLSNPNSVVQLQAWLNASSGVKLDNMRKKTVTAKLQEDIPLTAREMLGLRQEMGKTSVTKYKALISRACRDNRMRGALQFYGAIRTGRWAGRGAQLHNLARNTLPTLSEERKKVNQGVPVPLSVLSELIRTTIIPSKAKLISVDFSAIEARVLAWLAYEKWRLEVFKGDGRIYEASIAAMLGIPIDDVTKSQRQRGKVAELACGFGGGANALITMGGLDMGLTEDQLNEIKHAWREANPGVVKLWHSLERAAKYVVINPTKGAKVGHLQFGMRNGYLMMGLPSGRLLSYPNARMVEGKFGPVVGFDGLLPGTRKWGLCTTWGGKLVENATQATARDVMAHGMLKLDAAGHEIVLTVHDEVLIDTDDPRPDEVVSLITEEIDWAPGLPLGADADVLDFYRKV